MARQYPPSYNEEFLREGSPSGVFAESLPRYLAGTDNAIAATGVSLRPQLIGHRHVVDG